MSHSFLKYKILLEVIAEKGLITPLIHIAWAGLEGGRGQLLVPFLCSPQLPPKQNAPDTFCPETSLS